MASVASIFSPIDRVYLKLAIATPRGETVVLGLDMLKGREPPWFIFFISKTYLNNPLNEWFLT